MFQVPAALVECFKCLDYLHPDIAAIMNGILTSLELLSRCAIGAVGPFAKIVKNEKVCDGFSHKFRYMKIWSRSTSYLNYTTKMMNVLA
jgi:hypothetical protein